MRSKGFFIHAVILFLPVIYASVQGDLVTQTYQVSASLDDANQEGQLTGVSQWKPQ